MLSRHEKKGAGDRIPASMIPIQLRKQLRVPKVAYFSLHFVFSSHEGAKTFT
jgi:hypothetical protein